MATANQIAANRLNSQKSTGPRSDAGKDRSRMNALKTGVHAESHCILGEDPAEETFDQKARTYDDPNNRFHVLPPKHPHAAAFNDLEDRLERLQRRLHAYERSAARALKQVRDLQSLENEPSPDEIGFVPSNSPVGQAPRPAPDPQVPLPAQAAPPENRASTSPEPQSPTPIGFVRPIPRPPAPDSPDPSPQLLSPPRF